MKQKNLLVIAAVVYGLTAYFSVGYFHPDEHHQILEFAFQILGLMPGSEMPWEFEAQMRPTIQPLMVAGFYKFFSLFGTPNPFHVSTFLRFLSAALSLLSLNMLLQYFKPKNATPNLMHLWNLLCLFLWFNVFVNVRFSSENWSASFFIIAFCMAFSTKHKSVYHLLLTGALLGFSILFRFQTGIMVLGLMAWFALIDKRKLQELFFISLGVILAIGIGIISDFYVYGEWTLSFYNYLEQNLILGKASSFGVEPWWYYISEGFLSGIPPFSLIFIGAVAIIFFLKPKNVLTWVFIPFILIHFLIGHKELRFLFPLFAFLPLFIVESLEIIQEKYPQFLESKGFKWTKKAFLLVNFILVAVIVFKPAQENISLYEAIYDQYEGDTEIYCYGNHPYQGVTELSYYQRPGYKTLSVKKDFEIKLTEGTSVLLIEDESDVKVELPYKRKLIYSSFPEWIKMFDFNGWVGRTNFIKVYELENPD